MTAPNMAAITESLERSLQNCSLNTHRNGVVISRRGRRSSSASSSSSSSSAASSAPENNHPQSSEATLELNSHVSLPCHWEQCLDLKTGEVYYINWRNGMKAKEDPRRSNYNNSGDFLYSEYEEETSYDSEESSSESPPSPSSSSREQYREGDHVLVVAGCKSCLMYFMVPKEVEDCPKCNGQLLHFDRSESNSP